MALKAYLEHLILSNMLNKLTGTEEQERNNSELPEQDGQRK